MREQHPVAWLYFLSDMLLREHRSERNPHAGLHFAPTSDYGYRRWLETELYRIFRDQSSEVSHTRKFPNVAKNLIEPVVESQQVSDVLPTIWSTVATKWGV